MAHVMQQLFLPFVGRIYSVSYTHLRQLKTNNMGSRTIDEGAIDEKSGMNVSEYVAVLSGNTDLLDKARLETVSYTHLDVYKRQVYELVAGRMLETFSGACVKENTFLTPVSYTHLDVYKRQGLNMMMQHYVPKKCI